MGPRAGEGFGREADVEGVAEEREEAREGRVGRREREEEVLCAPTWRRNSRRSARRLSETDSAQARSVAHLGWVQSRKDGDRQPERADEQPERGEFRRVGSHVPPSLQPWMHGLSVPFWLRIQEGLRDSDPALKHVWRCYDLRLVR